MTLLANRHHGRTITPHRKQAPRGARSAGCRRRCFARRGAGGFAARDSRVDVEIGTRRAPTRQRPSSSATRPSGERACRASACRHPAPPSRENPRSREARRHPVLPSAHGSPVQVRTVKRQEIRTDLPSVSARISRRCPHGSPVGVRTDPRPLAVTAAVLACGQRSQTFSRSWRYSADFDASGVGDGGTCLAPLAARRERW
jgi:hypothetical protein